MARRRRRNAPSPPPATKRKRYNSLGQHEVCYQAWYAEGTYEGAVRRLRTVEGFESIDVRTLKSIYEEKRGTEYDWDRRKAEFTRELAQRIDSEAAEEIAAANARLRKRLVSALEKLAGVAEDKLPGALARVLGDFGEDGELTGQARVYGFPKVLDSLIKALRPPGPAGSRGPDAAPGLVVNIGAALSPHRQAKLLTQTQIEADVKRKELACEQGKV